MVITGLSIGLSMYQQLGFAQDILENLKQLGIIRVRNDGFLGQLGPLEVIIVCINIPDILCMLDELVIQYSIGIIRLTPLRLGDNVGRPCNPKQSQDDGQVFQTRLGKFSLSQHWSEDQRWTGYNPRFSPGLLGILPVQLVQPKL